MFVFPLVISVILIFPLVTSFRIIFVVLASILFDNNIRPLLILAVSLTSCEDEKLPIFLPKLFGDEDETEQDTRGA